MPNARRRRVAAVTGATAGIGHEFARQLAAGGYDLILASRDATRLGAVAGELSAAHGITVTTCPADLSDAEGLTRLTRFLDLHHVDLLVHNAGFATKGRLHTTPPEAQDAMLTLHVVATHRLVRAVLPPMIQRGEGAIVIVSSIASFMPSGANVNYVATKAYQRLFVESLALELAGTAVYAQALCPGFTRTEFHKRAALKMEGLPAWLWTEATDVVAESLRAVERRAPTVVIPSARWRLIVRLLNVLPQPLLRHIARRYRKTRDSRE